MAVVPPSAGEWFDAIPSWSTARVRSARHAAVAFALAVSSAIVPGFVVPRPASAPPLPSPDLTRITAGEWMRDFERCCKESAWITRGLRVMHDEAAQALGLTPPFMTQGQFHYESEAGELLDGAGMLVAMQRGFLVEPPWDEPRARPMVGPNQRFYLVYSDHRLLRRPWLDDRGRVLVVMNRFAIRDREDLEPEKPAGVERILCLGDSITMGWGAPEQSSWPRRMETILRAGRPSATVINTGGAGTVCVDEYWIALRDHWRMFTPDAVVVGTSINDLMPTNGLAVFPPEQGSLGGVMRTTRTDPLELDPAIDWVAKLRKLDFEQCTAAGLCGFDRPWDAMWDRGVPQRSLLAMRDWCRERRIPFVVALWPLLQGLGPGRTYPFASMHDEVAAFCSANAIPLADLLPALRAVPQEDLWVTPADMHPNPRAHAAAATAIAAILEPLLR